MCARHVTGAGGKGSRRSLGVPSTLMVVVLIGLATLVPPGSDAKGIRSRQQNRDDPGWGDVSSQDNQIDRVALQAHQQARSQNELNDPQVSDFSDVDTQTDNNDINLAASEPVAMNLAAASETLNSADPETGFVTGFTFYVIVAGCSVAGMVGLVVAGVCWYRLQKNVKAASEAEYPAYGVTGPTKERTPSPGDRKLAQSAQMYHYQHQKQQMLALEKANNEMNQEASDDDSDEENDEGNYTVYECPGLATTGEMEVKNPMFEETPVNPPHTESGQEATEK